MPLVWGEPMMEGASEIDGVAIEVGPNCGVFAAELRLLMLGVAGELSETLAFAFLSALALLKTNSKCFSTCII